MLISIQTLLSNGFGGSVGLEAGYTQIRPMFGSCRPETGGPPQRHARWWLCGDRRVYQRRLQRLWRAPSMPLKWCSGPIPLPDSAPVVASAVGAWLVARHLTHQSFLMVPGFPSPVSVRTATGQTVLIGIICAFGSIAVMIAVAFS